MKSIRYAIVMLLVFQLFGVIDEVNYVLALCLYLGSLFGSFVWGVLGVLAKKEGE